MLIVGIILSFEKCRTKIEIISDDIKKSQFRKN